MVIGMPRGMMYYKYFPFWRAFFGELGQELTTSSPTNRKILNLGLEAAENEFCLPLKVFYGHTLSLKDEVDALFIPRIVSVRQGEYTCPKLLGLPDLIRAIDDDLPPVLGLDINVRKNRRGYYQSIYQFGRHFTTNPALIYKAYKKAEQAEKQFKKALQQGLTPQEAIEQGQMSDVSTCQHLSGVPHPTSDIRPPAVSIGIVGHDYNLYDSYITMNLTKKLRELGAKIVTPESLSPEVIEQESLDLPKKLFWTYEQEIVGAAFHWLKKQSVSGIIYVLAFACGPDSFIQTVIEHRARKEGKIPVMSLVIDEHSTEVGMITRLEAFVDMIKRKLATN